MSRPTTPKKSNDEWKADPNRVLSINGLKEHKLIVGGHELSANMYETVRTEAHSFMEGLLPDFIANMILNEAARFALEEAKPNESSEVRSAKLAFAQGMAQWNVHFMNAMKILSKM